MTNILIMDDNLEKKNNISNVLKSVFPEREDIVFCSATYAIEAKSILAEKNIDILILDICIPNSLGETPVADGGIQFLRSIRGAERYTYPRYVIALSEYEESIVKFELEEGLIHSSIYYDSSTNEWQMKLAESYKTVVSTLSNGEKRTFDYDVAFICALEEELRFIKKCLTDICELNTTNDDEIYYAGTILDSDRCIRVVLTQLPHMGMVAASTITSKVIANFTPKYVVMTGITAGIRDKNNYGDVICAEYAWDYGAGKEMLKNGEHVHKNTITQIRIGTSILNSVRRIAQNKDILNRIKENFDGDKPQTELSVHCGPVASGASVVAYSQIVDDIKNNQIRDVLAIEMEIFGVYYACEYALLPKPQFVALKSVCDFADEEKNDQYHKYASYTSAEVAMVAVKNYFVF